MFIGKKIVPLIGLDIYSNVNKQMKMFINSKIYNWVF